MNEETKVCKYCQTEIPKKAKICPNCRKKQGGKKWIIIAAVVVVLFIAIANAGGNDDSSKPSTSNTTNTVDKNETDKQDTVTSDDNSKSETTKSEVKDTTNNTTDDTETDQMSPLAIYQRLGSYTGLPYTITDKAQTFLKEHEDMFPAKGKVDDDLVDYSIDYRQILKNEKKFGDKLMYVADAGVVQISEEEISDGKYFTTLNVTDGDQQYYVYYIGELDNIYEDSEISIAGLPLGTSQFDNTNGGQTIVVVLAGTKVEEVSNNY